MIVEVGCLIFFASKTFPSLNSRDGMYDIALYFLAMLIGVAGSRICGGVYEV